MHNGKTKSGLSNLDIEKLKRLDLVIVTAAHTNVDYNFIQKHSLYIFDTKNAMKDVINRENIELL
jgi:UDP-N-acetyl-D-glucosamine dehydrogenase